MPMMAGDTHQTTVAASVVATAVMSRGILWPYSIPNPFRQVHLFVSESEYSTSDTIFVSKYSNRILWCPYQPYSIRYNCYLYSNPNPNPNRNMKKQMYQWYPSVSFASLVMSTQASVSSLAKVPCQNGDTAAGLVVFGDDAITNSHRRRCGADKACIFCNQYFLWLSCK